MMPNAIHTPVALWINGSASKFMPKMPVIRFSGRKIAVSTVRVRMMALVRLRQRREVQLHRALGRLLEPPHVRQHPLDVLEHVARAHAQQLLIARRRAVARLGHSSSASSHSCIALRWSSQVSSSECSALRDSSSSRQSLKLAVRVQQLLLQLAELARQQAPQLQVAVDHVVDHAQHQVRRAGGQPADAAHVGALAELVQALREVLAHHAVRRVHAHQHAVEHGKPNRTGVDRLDGAFRGWPHPRRSALPDATSRRNTSMSYHEV